MSQKTNACGECTACCFALQVNAIHKPMYEWCPHCEKEHGCSVYDTRPEPCRTYECVWLSCNWHKNMRPDQLGTIFDFGYHQGLDEYILQVWETKEGAAGQNQSLDIVRVFLKRGVFVLAVPLAQESVFIVPKNRLLGTISFVEDGLVIMEQKEALLHLMAM